MNTRKIHWQDGYSQDELSSRARKVGLYVFMGVMTSLFLLMITAYFTRSQYSDWQPLRAESWQLWLNTTMLFLGSIALQWSLFAMSKGKPERALTGFGLGGLFAIAFLIGQLSVWQSLRAHGYFVNSNPANSFFYLLTAMHGIHLLGGLVVWGRILIKLYRGKSNPLQLKPLPLKQVRSSQVY